MGACPPPPVSFTALSDAPERDVVEAVANVSDCLKDPSATLAQWRARHRALRQSPGSEFWAVDLVGDATGPAGWAGWIPYLDAPRTWQSSTWLAPRLRGRGLLPLLRCRQVHLAAALVSHWELSDVRFVSSIDQRNLRSVRASLRYAAAHGWPAATLVDELTAGRRAWRIEWPDPPPHTCFVPNTCFVPSTLPNGALGGPTSLPGPGPTAG